MARKGLTKDRIVEVALTLIEEKGLTGFSLRALASSLNVQVSSLYNHISGQQELLTEAGLRAVELLRQQEEESIRGKSRDEGLFALADSYRSFAFGHPELYRIIMGVHTLELPALESAAGQIAGPILRVLSSYGIDETAQIHYQRILRSIMHGFFAHEASGGFSASAVDREDSYRLAIACVAEKLSKEAQYIETE